MGRALRETVSSDSTDSTVPGARVSTILSLSLGDPDSPSQDPLSDSSRWRLLPRPLAPLSRIAIVSNSKPTRP